MAGTKRALTTVLSDDDLPEGVRHVALPTIFPVGPVNCWLFAERPVTLVDPGMYIPESLTLMEDLLRSEGLAWRDVDQVLFTHGHPDHYGSAGWIAERSGATLLCGTAERRKIVNDPPMDYEFARTVIDALGMPPEVIATMPDGMEMLREFIREPPADRLVGIDDGSTLDIGGRRFEVHVTPGHAEGHVSLFDGSTLVSGDHLLPEITPNPAIEFDPSEKGGRRRSLVEYLDGLDRFVMMAPATVLPGHGPMFTDVPRLVTEMRSHHATRADHILSVVGDLGAPCAYDVSVVLFPELEGMNVMLGLAEVVGHLDLLMDAGTVSETDPGPPRRYKAA